MYLVHQPQQIYQNTQTAARELVQCQTLIRKVFTQETSLAAKVYQAIASLWRNKPQLTLEDLFNLQQKNIALLNNELSNTVEDSKLELKNLEDYVDKRTRELYEAIQLSPQRKVNLDAYKNKKISKLERRALMETLQSYHLLNETIVDTAKELEFVDALEDIFRIVLHTSERTLRKSERLEQHIANTKLAYVAIVRQHNVIASLGKAIDTMEQFSREIFFLIDNASQTILHIANNGFTYNPGQLQATLTTASSINTLNAREAERIAKKISAAGNYPH